MVVQILGAAAGGGVPQWNCVSDKRPRLSRHVRLHTDKVSGAPVLLLPETIIVLNQTGYDILRLCDGSRTTPEIVQVLGSKYSADRLTLSREIFEYLQAIRQKGLIAWS
jgi:coenzyme PQQ biosynthesis protein PqqD